jgi:hypothetical protein
LDISEKAEKNEKQSRQRQRQRQRRQSANKEDNSETHLQQLKIALENLDSSLNTTLVDQPLRLPKRSFPANVSARGLADGFWKSLRSRHFQGQSLTCRLYAALDW